MNFSRWTNIPDRAERGIHNEQLFLVKSKRVCNEREGIEFILCFYMYNLHRIYLHLYKKYEIIIC